VKNTTKRLKFEKCNTDILVCDLCGTDKNACVTYSKIITNKLIH